MNYKKIPSAASFETCDILLFEDTSGWWFSNIIKWFTGSIYNHVALVLKNPTYMNPDLNMLCILESGIEPFPDAENKIVKFGVQINELFRVVSDYPGHVWIRHLDAQIPIKTIEKELTSIHNSFHNKPYDWNPYDLLNTVLRFKNADNQRNNNFFCSSLVAYIYTKLGLFNDNEQWDLITPSFFSTDVKLNNASLGELIQLK